MNIFLIFFLSFILVEISTPFVIDFLKRIGIIDKPSERKIHKVEIPRMGGIIIFSIVLIIILSFYGNINSIRLFLIGLLVIFLCGLLDDLFNLSWKAKLFIQVFAVILLTSRFIFYFDQIVFFGFILPFPISYLILYFFILGTINSINMLDGLDGLVSGYTILAIMFLGFLSFYKNDILLSILSISILGALLAFLKYNSFPAKIFLGDTGSLVIGYFLVFISIDSQRLYTGRSMDLTFPFFFFGLPIMDMLKVIVKRIRKKRLPFVADQEHIHHILISHKIRHKTAVFLIHLISILFMLNAVLNLKYKNYFYLFILVFLLLSLSIFFMNLILNIYRINYKKAKNIFSSFSDYPNYFKTFYKKVLLSFSLLAFLIILILSFNPFIKLPFNLMFILLISGILLTYISYSHQKKFLNSATIYVFFNLLFIFSIQQFIPKLIYQIPLLVFLNNLGKIMYYFIIIVDVIFVIGRYGLLKKTEIFFNGYDLSLFSFVLMFFIIQSFGEWDLNRFNFPIMSSVVIYIWYKIISEFKKEVSNYLFFGLFVFNIVLLTTSLILN